MSRTETPGRAEIAALTTDRDSWKARAEAAEAELARTGKFSNADWRQALRCANACRDEWEAMQLRTEAKLEAAKAKLRAAEDRLFALGEMAKAPCFACGYNGADYFRPGTHPCAARHHALAKEPG